MPYGNSRLTAGLQAGDPFLGGLIKGIGRVAKGAVGGFLGGGPVGAILGGISGARGRPRAQPPVQIPGLTTPPIPFQVGRIVAGRIQQGRGAKPPEPRMTKDGRVTTQRRRRMNPTNVKALRRATRRLSSFQREVKKVEKELRKIAPKPRTRAKRDLGPGHTHVR